MTRAQADTLLPGGPGGPCSIHTTALYIRPDVRTVPGVPATCDCTAAGEWVCRAGETETVRRRGPCACPCHYKEPTVLSHTSPGMNDLSLLASRYRNYSGQLFAQGDDEGAAKYREMVKHVEALMVKVSECPLPVVTR